MKVTDLKHLLNVVVFGLEQLAPGGQVAVGEDSSGLQHPVSVTLQTNTQTNKSISPSVGDMTSRRQTILCEWNMMLMWSLLNVSAFCELLPVSLHKVISIVCSCLWTDTWYVLHQSGCLIHFSWKQLHVFSDYYPHVEFSSFQALETWCWIPTLMKSNWWVCHVSSDKGYVSYRIPEGGGTQRQQWTHSKVNQCFFMPFYPSVKCENVPVWLCLHFSCTGQFWGCGLFCFHKMWK